MVTEELEKNERMLGFRVNSFAAWGKTKQQIGNAIQPPKKLGNEKVGWVFGGGKIYDSRCRLCRCNVCGGIYGASIRFRKSSVDLLCLLEFQRAVNFCQGVVVSLPGRQNAV